MHVMLDIETLGTQPGSTILSIGAIGFLPTGVIKEATFHQIINRASCADAGLTEDRATLDWWGRQSMESAKLLSNAYNGETSYALVDVLYDFRTWLKQVEMQTIWGNGAAFDNALVATAARRCGFGARGLWSHRRDRCYRTIAGMVQGIKLERVGIYHNALDDATTQAQHLCKILHATGLANFFYSVDEHSKSVSGPDPTDLSPPGPTATFGDHQISSPAVQQGIVQALITIDPNRLNLATFDTKIDTKIDATNYTQS